eukprot:scaffold67652_cov36-Phaeocystis_antarctica.AAC.1
MSSSTALFSTEKRATPPLPCSRAHRAHLLATSPAPWAVAMTMRNAGRVSLHTVQWWIFPWSSGKGGASSSHRFVPARPRCRSRG